LSILVLLALVVSCEVFGYALMGDQGEIRERRESGGDDDEIYQGIYRTGEDGRFNDETNAIVCVLRCHPKKILRKWQNLITGLERSLWAAKGNIVHFTTRKWICRF